MTRMRNGPSEVKLTPPLGGGVFEIKSIRVQVSVFRRTDVCISGSANREGLGWIRSKPVPVKGYRVKVPREFMKLHKEVFLTADIFFVNGIPFFITVSRKIDYIAVSCLHNRKAKTIFKAFVQIYRFYKQ